MYILLFKNSEVNYQVHPYFFLRRMLEGKDEFYNNLPENVENETLVEFILTAQPKNNKNTVFNNFFFGRTVIPQLTGYDIFTFLEKKRNATQFEGIAYVSGNNNACFLYLHEYFSDLFDIQSRILDGVHQDLEQCNEIDVSWNNSNAILKRIVSLPKEIVFTENGEELVY